MVKAVEILCESRKQLMNSHILVYFVNPLPQKEIFEMIQKDLQSATQELSKGLEEQMNGNEENTIDIDTIADVKIHAK